MIFDQLLFRHENIINNERQAFIPAEYDCIKMQLKTSELIVTRQKDIALKAIMPD